MEGKEFPAGADRLLSIKEVAACMHCGQTLVSEMVNIGLMKALRFRRDRRIPISEYNRFVREHLDADIYEVLANAKRTIPVA